MYEVRVTKLNDDKVIGLASLVVDGEFVFNGIKLVATDNTLANKGRGYNVVMPTYKSSYGEYEAFFKPVTRNMYDKLTYNIHRAYESGEVIGFGESHQQLGVSVKQLKQNIQDGGTKKADVTIAFNKEFICDSVSVRENMTTGELFVAYPSYKTKNKDGGIEYKNICNPISRDFKDKISNQVLSEIKKPEKERGVDLSIAAPKPTKRYSKDKQR